MSCSPETGLPTSERSPSGLLKYELIYLKTVKTNLFFEPIAV